MPSCWLVFSFVCVGEKRPVSLREVVSKLIQAECDWNLVCAFSGIV